MFRSKFITVLNSISRVLLLLMFCISQGSVVTHLRCSGKYNTNCVANLLLSPTVNFFKNQSTFLRVTNEYRVTCFFSGSQCSGAMASEASWKDLHQCRSHRTHHRSQSSRPAAAAAAARLQATPTTWPSDYFRPADCQDVAVCVWDATVTRSTPLLSAPSLAPATSALIILSLLPLW